jgi:hypothetical protein
LRLVAKWFIFLRAFSGGPYSMLLPRSKDFTDLFTLIKVWLIASNFFSVFGPQPTFLSVVSCGTRIRWTSASSLASFSCSGTALTLVREQHTNHSCARPPPRA